mgnify:FL=1
MSEDGSSSQERYLLRERVGSTRTVVLKMPEGWARAGLSGVEAALLGWAVPALLGVYGLLAQSGNPWLQEMDLSQAAGVGAGFWALSLGSPMTLSGLPVTLIPLFWTILQILLLRLLLRQGRESQPAAQWFAVPTFAGTAVILLLFSPVKSNAWALLVGATLVAVVAASWAAAARTSKWPAVVQRFSKVWSGCRLGLRWLGALGVVGLLAVGVSTVHSWPAVVEISEAVGAQGLSGWLLSAVQLMYLPNFAAWGLSWLAGPGFSLSGGLPSSPSSVAAGDLPAFPVAALVPETAPGAVVVLFLIGAGVLTGVASGWTLRKIDIRTVLVRLGAAAAFFSALVGIWFALATGALGEELMSRVGPMPLAWPLVVLEFAVPAAVVALAMHPASHAFARKAAALVANKAQTSSAAE